MKHIGKLLAITLLVLFAFSSCDDMLDVNSDRIITEEEYQLSAANDSLYSMFGVFSKLQKLADSYVLTGELRADLLDLNDNANVFLKELNNLNYSANNPYVNNIADYYAVINNCNYIVKMVDTTTVKGGVLVMKRLVAAAKAVRAWTYMQVALNFGTATYYETPILSLADAEKIEKNAPRYTLHQMAPYLIADLTPYKDEETLSLGTFYNLNIRNSFFPINFLLGDLYLWTDQYEKAATEYYELMYKRTLLVNPYYRTYYGVTGNAFNGNIWNSNLSPLSPGSIEYITNIVASNQYGTVFQLDSMNRNYMLKASDVLVNYWDTQRYFQSNALDTVGDLRKWLMYNRYAFTSVTEVFEKPVITKYVYLNPKTTDEKTNRQVSVYRNTMLYLRYAEAVNRLGKHHLALAVLKHGLNATTLDNNSMIPLSEKGEVLPAYMNFKVPRFNISVGSSNVGIRFRSLGNVHLDPLYVLPTQEALDAMGLDMTTYMENEIIEEMALENCFEGNRFHDLMRIAMRRNDDAFLADKVASKHKNNQAAIRAKLMNRNNWYLKVN